VEPAREGLGVETIMDRALAARFGVPYVHLAAFAIDLDRIAVEVADDPRWPAGVEVALTARYLEEHLDPDGRGEHLELVTEAVESVMEGGQALGAQLPFAVWDLVRREVWPRILCRPFDRWEKPPKELARQLDRLYGAGPEEIARLARACQVREVEPPLAPPTRGALARLAGHGA